MGSIARIAALGSALVIGACATLAGLDDPAAIDDATAREGGASSSSGSVQDTGNASSSGGSSSGATTTDGSSSSSGSPADAQPDVPACTLAKIGDNCTQPSQCCSGKCNEKRLCANDCENAGNFNCDPTSDDDCCVGLWCNFGSCSTCIVANQQAASPGGVPNPRSCCSRTLQNGVGPNCQ